MTTTAVTEAPSYAQLAGLTQIDLPAKLNAGLAGGARATGMVADVLSSEQKR